MKRTIKILIISIIVIFLLLASILLYSGKLTKVTVNGVVAFGEVDKETRHFLLSFYDLKEKKLIKNIDIGNSFSRNIFLEKNSNNIWIPCAYTDNLAEVSNKVKILDVDNKITEISLGLSPVDITFFNDLAAVTCLEKGIHDVSVYFVDKNNYKILTKIQIGGDTFRFADININNGLYYLITQDVENHISILSIIDLNTKSLINQIKYPNIPLNGIKVINENIWIAGGQGVKIIDSKTGDLIKEIQTEAIPYQLDYDNNVVVLSHYFPDNQLQKGLSIINPKDNKVKKINLKDKFPSSIQINEDKLYLIDDMAGILTVFDLMSEEIIETVHLGQFPTNLVFLNN